MMSRCGECKLGCNEEGALYCEENLGYEQCIDRLQDALYELFADRPQGEWTDIYQLSTDGRMTARCKNCREKIIFRDETPNFCSHCGVKMKGGDNE